MRNKVCTEKQFLKDVQLHKIEVVRDDGVNRHIRFRRPGTRCMGFDLITWPGHLCYTGDMGTYVFSRLEDMFAFFRTDRDQYLREGQTLAINLGYWAEKILAPDRHDGIKEFSEEKFDRGIKEHFVGWIRGHLSVTTKKERRELWEAVVSEVIGAEGDSGGYRKQCAAHDFTYRVNDRVWFEFTDFSETTVDEYSYRFVWCCYALSWGIREYDRYYLEQQEGPAALAV